MHAACAGPDAIFILVLATMMLPYPVTMVPLYVLFNRWLGQHFLPLIVPAFFGSPFYIFLLRHFFLSIPRGRRMRHASTAPISSRSSGASFCPSRMPAMATVAIFTFQFTWNDFLPPLIYLHDQRLYTVALGTELLSLQLPGQLGLSDGGVVGDMFCR